MSLGRKLTQNDLRKAMNEQKKKFGIIKKIDSPLAKYPFYNLKNLRNLFIGIFFNLQNNHIIYVFIR